MLTPSTPQTVMGKITNVLGSLISEGQQFLFPYKDEVDKGPPQLSIL